MDGMFRKLGLAVAMCLIVIGGTVFVSKMVYAPPHHQPATIHTLSTPPFNKRAYSTSDPASMWVVVNKQHPLSPRNYTPDLVIPSVPMRSNISSDERQVNRQMAPALETLITAAKAEDVNLNLQSGYRSYSFQMNLYSSYVKNSGQAAADRFSARPGYSEHQTGLAADLGGTSNPGCNVEQCFDGTTEGKWLAANAYKYGFIIRYPSDKESVTGYEYEPWHIRYVGKTLSVELHDKGVETLEEFFSVNGGTVYAP